LPRLHNAGNLVQAVLLLVFFGAVERVVVIVPYLLQALLPVRRQSRIDHKFPDSDFPPALTAHRRHVLTVRPAYVIGGKTLPFCRLRIAHPDSIDGDPIFLSGNVFVNLMVFNPIIADAVETDSFPLRICVKPAFLFQIITEIVIKIANVDGVFVEDNGRF